MQKRILIIGPNDKHLSSLIQHLDKENNNDYLVDKFSLAYELDRSKEFSDKFCLRRKFPSSFYKTKLAILFSILDALISFRQIKKKYQLINLHFITIDAFFLLPFLKKKSYKIMATPWGSDVLRVKNKTVIKMMTYFYSQIDYISLSKIRFRDDTVKKFKIPEEKIVDLGFGATMIDYIGENITDVDSAKLSIGFEGQFIISCGYNRSKLQNHKLIIEALGKVKDELPENLLIVFPFTYNGPLEPYKSDLIRLLHQNGLNNYHFYVRFLENEVLKNLIYATDLFIHIQETDANSASLQEYLLAQKTVINGEWLIYNNLEVFGFPYYAAGKNNLSKTLLDVIGNNYQTLVNQNHIKEIKSFGWKNRVKAWHQFYATL